MATITVTNLTFSYEGSYDTIFADLNLQLSTDWKLGFIGRNGRGKTTFLRLLLGQLEYRGQISAPCGFDYFPFAVAEPTRETLAVLREAAPEAELWQLERELSLLEMREDLLQRPFASLSHGEQTKTLLAALFCRENRFLLIDEPTNHLDLEARTLVSRYLNRKQGFILVSHDRYFLDQCIDHVLSLNQNSIALEKGNYSSWLDNKTRRDAFELAEHEKLSHSIEQLTEDAKRKSGWSNDIEKRKTSGHKISGIKADKGYLGHQSAKMMKRAKAAETKRARAIEEKSGLLKDVEKSVELRLHPLRYHSEVLAELRELAVCYDGRPVAEPLTWQIRRGEQIALCGKNGAGKSSLLKLLAGEPLAYQGEFWRGSGLKISVIPQDTSRLQGDLREFCRQQGIDESLFKATLRQLDFQRSQFDKDMAEFSAGQKKKVLLAKSLCEEAELFLWDEPLNYIDVISRAQIEQLLRDYRPTMVFVEHDRAFLDAVASRQIQLAPFTKK